LTNSSKSTIRSAFTPDIQQGVKAPFSNQAAEKNIKPLEYADFFSVVSF
jgi:hypothetical protein